MKQGLTTATAIIKILVLYQRVVKRNAQFIKPTLIVTSLDINKNVTLAHVKQHVKIVSGIIKSRSTTLNIKTTRIYQNNFGKLKSAVEHQKSDGRLSEYAVLTIQTVSTAFLGLNEKYEITTYKGDNPLNKRTEIINTCRHRSKYKLANYHTID